MADTINSTYVVSPDFDPTVVPEGYIWDETAFQELVKATDKAAADETIFTYGGPQGDAGTDYNNIGALTISNQKYDGEGQTVDTTITGLVFNNAGTVTTDGAIVFSVKSFTNSGEFDLDKTGSLTATSAVTNTATGTINLNAGTTLQGTTIGNTGTITVVSDHAAINGAISNHGTIDALMKKLIVTGDIQNANKDDARIVRNACVIKAREFEVTGNVLNYGAIGGESIPVNTMTVSGSLSTYNYLKATILTADSILNDSIQSEVEGEGSRGFIDAGEINAGSVDNVSGIIMTGTSKETGVGINVTGTINNGSADLVVPAKINAGTNGWIKAASINNIGTDIENSLITAGKITVADIVNNGGFSTRIIENTGTITNNATGLFAVIYIDDPIVTGFVEGASINAGTIINGGTFAVYSEAALPTPVSVTSFENSGMLLFSGAGMTLTGDIVNNADGQFDVAGTVTGTTATITNSGTFNISNDDDVSGVLTADAVTNTATGTINLNAGTTLQGSTVVNAGTITVVSDHAAINGAISNHGTIDALMKKLTVTGDIQNANYDDTKNPRDNSIIIAREFEVTGNVVNYGIIGEVDREIHTFDVSGELSNGFQILVDILTADSIENKSIASLDIEKSTRAYIVAGEVNAGSIDNVFGTIQTGEAKESGVGLNVTGTINNGNADNDSAEINAGLNGWIQAGSLNNIGTDYEKSLIETGKLTVGNIVNNGGISARIVESTGTITNNATGLFAVLYIDDPTITGLSEAASLTAGTIINGGSFTIFSEAALPTQVSVTSFENSGMLLFSGAGMTLTGDIVNNADGQFDVAGTVTGTTATITNSGTISIDNHDDISGVLTAGAITNTATGTISLDDDSTLTGTTVINGGTITVASGHAALNGAISNHSLIDSVMKTLNVTGDIQNANEDDMREARNSSIIKIRNLNVTGNVTNYGVIGTEFQEANDITISGDLRNFHQIIVKTTLTADSVYQDYIDSEVEEKRCVGYIICGQVIAGEINNASGEISAGADKDAGIAIEATGKITNGKADALFTATLQAGDDGCIQAVDALNNIGAGSTVHAGYITVLKGTEAGDLTNDGIIQTKSITVDGSVTNSATGSIEIDGASTEPGNLSGTSIGNAGTLNLNGNVTLSGDVDNSNLLNFQGTVTATGSITNAETGTINIKSAGSITDTGTITNSGTLHIAIQSGNENKITADKFFNTEGVGKITIGGSFAGGVASVITATEGDVKASDITLSVTSADEKEVTAVTRGGNVAIATGVDYSTIYLSNGIDEDAIGTVAKDSTGASYYVDFNAFKFPASALEDGVKDTTTTILIDGTTAGALKYESETTAAIDGLAFAKDGTNAATPEEEKNVEFTLTGMDPANPESYRDLKKGITVGAGVTLTVDKLRQTGEEAVTNVNGELRMGTYNTGLPDDPETTDVDESVGSGSFQVAAGQVNVNGGGALYDCTVLSGGTVTVYDGGYAEDVTAENGGCLEVCEGGAASAVTVDFGGDLFVSDGGKAIQVRENGGYVQVEDGADVSFVSNTIEGLVLTEYEWATLHSGTTATDVSVNYECNLEVFDGGIADVVDVNADGRLLIHAGGKANGVTVNASGTAEVSSGVIEGAVVDAGGSLLVYSGAKLTGWMTFKNGAEVIPFVGSILDFDLTQTVAGADALVNDLSILMGKPSYTLTVDGNELKGNYKLAGGATGFKETITVVNTFGEELGTLTVGGEDLSIYGKTYLLALNGSDLSVTVDPSNKPDDGTNDFLYDKKNGIWNDANITVENWISASSLAQDNTVYLDVPGSINQMDIMYNMVGYNTPDQQDTGDTARISVHDPAKLTFQVVSDFAGTFYVYEKVYDTNKGTYKQVQIGKVSVRKDNPAYLKDVCITADGDYFVQMAANSAAYKKEGTKGYYNVTVVSDKSEFFDDVDNGWNDSYASALVQVEPVHIDRNTSFVALDDNVESADDWNFVGGISDVADFARIDLDSSAFLSLDVIGAAASDGSAKFTIWKFNGTKGLKKVTSVTLKAGKYEQTTKGVFLDQAGEYFISMESTDAAKGRSVSYQVTVNTSGTRFFDSADDNRNNVLYDKTHKTVYGEDKVHHFVVNAVSAASSTFSLDDNAIGLEGFENFVGYGDKVDYAKFTVTQKGTLSFTVTATEGATFEVWTLANGKLKSLGKTKLKLGKDQTTCTGNISGLSLEVGTEYYVSMTAAKTTANTKGSVFYSVSATLTPQNESSLTMPETASIASSLSMPETDSLGISDAMSFGGYDTYALADASASSFADLNDNSTWQSLLA